MSKVNLEDRRDAEGRGWGPPCHAQLITVHAGGISVPVDKRIADLVSAGLHGMSSRGFALHAGWCWGYACRHIVNDPSKPMSNHSWGLAIDLNAPVNGYGARTHTITQALASNVWNPMGFRWGGDYVDSPKDWMHFEFMGTPSQAAALVKSLKKNAHPPVQTSPAKKPAYPGHAIKFGTHGEAVTLVQRALKVPVDGIAGRATIDAINKWKETHGLKGDGILGHRAWPLLFH